MRAGSLLGSSESEWFTRERAVRAGSLLGSSESEWFTRERAVRVGSLLGSSESEWFTRERAVRAGSFLRFPGYRSHRVLLLRRSRARPQKRASSQANFFRNTISDFSLLYGKLAVNLTFHIFIHFLPRLLLLPLEFFFVSLEFIRPHFFVLANAFFSFLF